MNILDRIVAAVSPVAGLRRAAARAQIDMIRSYDAAKMGRRTGGWIGSNASANAATRGALDRLRARSHDVVRNTWWGPRIVAVFTAHAVGTGIVPMFRTGNRTLDRRAQKVWKDFVRHSDAEGQLNLYGQMALACRTIAESGEVLVRIVNDPESPSRVPIRLQLLEPDHLDSARDRVGADAVVDQGIEYGPDGRRRAYWILPEHPGQRGLAMRGTSVRVPASSVMHVYRKERIGQGRGVPMVTPVMLKGRDVADLEEAITVKARVEACLALLIKSEGAMSTLGQAHVEKRPEGDRRIETLSPAMIKYLGPGESAEVVNPSSSLAFESVLLNTWMTLAAGAGLTYDQLTGDLRQANYSSLRAGKIEFRRLIEQFQWLTLEPMLLTPIAETFAFWAQESGALPARAGGYPAEWIMPAVEPIDPKKDLEADILAVRAGRMTWPQFVAAWGFDPDEQLDQIAEWQGRIDAKKIAVDTDARRPRNGGQPQQQEQDNGRAVED